MTPGRDCDPNAPPPVRGQPFRDRFGSEPTSGDLLDITVVSGWSAR
ncbi:hypothetical protein [Streptomyces sp. NBC_00454]